MPTSRSAACRSLERRQVPAAAGRRPARPRIRRHPASATADLFLRADLNLAQSKRSAAARPRPSRRTRRAASSTSSRRPATPRAARSQLADRPRLRHAPPRLRLWRPDQPDTLRFHVGGFYRHGEGPRATGYTPTRAASSSSTSPRNFDGGFVRLYGKYLDDRTPSYQPGAREGDRAPTTSRNSRICPAST
jgi:hypothetical protein